MGTRGATPAWPRLGRARSTASFVGAAGSLAVASLYPGLGAMAWAGAAALAFGLSSSDTPARRLLGGGGVVLVYFFATFVPLIPSLMSYGDVSLARALVGVVELTVVFGATLHVALLPLVVFARRLPVWVSLPLAWSAGEWLEVFTSKAPYADLLYTQWQVQPILRALGRFGWYPTLFGWLLGCAAIGDGLARRRAWVALSGAVVLAVLGLLPPLPARGEEVLAGVAAVQMSDVWNPPATLPDHLRLVVWPEATRTTELVPIEEGERSGSAADFPGLGDQEARPAELINVVAETSRGLMNATVAVDPERHTVAMRGKTDLAPVGERRFLGVGSNVWAPGSGLPMLVVGGHRVIPAICYEAFSRELVADGRAKGGDLLAIMSNDYPILEDPGALSRSMGAAVLRSVEFGIPVVRAALAGEGALILPDGTIVANGSMHTTTVLQVGGSP